MFFLEKRPFLIANLWIARWYRLFDDLTCYFYPYALQTSFYFALTLFAKFRQEAMNFKGKRSDKPD